MNVTHGRHCSCSACAREDWTRPGLAPCGMHGPNCPAIYTPADNTGNDDIDIGTCQSCGRYHNLALVRTCPCGGYVG